MDSEIRDIISEKFDQIIDVLHEGYILVDEDAKIIDANPAYCDMVGYTKSELLSMSLHDVRPGMSDEYKQNFIENVEEQGSIEFETQHRTKSGEMIDLNASAGIITINGKRYLAGFVRDITEQKKVENELNRSEKQLKSLFDHNPLPVYLFDLEGNFRRLNDRLVEFTGYNRDELKKLSFEDFIHPDDLERTQEHFNKALSGESGQYEIRVIVRGGEEREIRVTKFPMYEEGEVAGVYGILEDITQQKVAERNLEHTKNRLQSLFKHNPHPVYYFDLEGNFMGANKRTEEVSGYPEKELLSMNFAPIIVEEDLERTQEHFNRAVSGSVEIYEIKIQTKQGEVKDLRITNFPMRDNGDIEGVFGIAEDITEAKLAKQKLEESEQKFRSLFKHNPNAVYSFDLEGNFVMANKELEELTGYSIEELKEMNFAPLTREEDLERVWNHFEKAAQGEAQRYEATGIHKQGHMVYYHITNLPIYVNDEITGVFGIAQDITQQKELQTQLKKSEKRWQHLVEENPQPVQVTVDGEIVFINQAGAELYGAESPEEITGICVFDFSHPGFENEIAERKHKLENNLSVDKVHEHKIKRLDGESRFVEVHSIPIDYKGQKAIQTVIHDITERKKQEQVIKQSLKEKEVLLKEIHHRVKNNMAVVSGLLQLQAMNSDNEQLTEMLEESQLRIYSMAMIHEKLYQTETLSDINVEKYIKELVEVIKNTVVEEGVDVDISYHIDDLTLDIDQAIPCALILNELVVNCFKHAFSEIHEGQIKIVLREEDEKIKVKVSDNGKGLPESFDINENQTLGMSLIQTLSSQLEGEVGYSEDAEGTEFTVEFPKME